MVPKLCFSSNMKGIEMAGHRPWPLDPTQLGAFDYDEITAAESRPGKSRADRRKPYRIETRLIPTSEDSITHIFGLDQWFIHKRYETEAQRDFAFRVLVKKSKREFRGWSRTEWRKVG